jgi:glycosyltransferase involved in cell wall biosynthesis
MTAKRCFLDNAQSTARPAPRGAASGDPADESVLLLDISRLIWRGLRVGPTGIDRVELAYAEHFLLNSPSRPVLAVLHLFGFLFAVRSTGARQFIVSLAERWRGNTPKNRRSHYITVIKAYLRLLVCGWIGGRGLRKRLATHPGHPIFLVTSHNQVSLAFSINRIRRMFAAKTACLIHDAIPIEHPEYFPPGWDRRHHRLVKNAATLFDGVIANSETTARSLRLHLEPLVDNPISLLNIRVALLGADAFPRPSPPDIATELPYFVVLGTIEPRKNHLLLLNLWARLASTVRSPPRLVVIGARGWETEQIAAMLERSRRLRGLVREYNRLADAEIGSLMANARAVLVPSFAEGYGLPLAEALCTGVPAICSDIPPFREVGGNAPEYLDPLDLGSWLNAVVDYSQPNSVRRIDQLRRIALWQAPTWTQHFKIVDEMIADLSSPTRLAVTPESSGSLDAEEPVPALKTLRVRMRS